VRNYSTYCAAMLVLVASALSGCAPRADMEQVENNQSQLRGIVASDKQEIDKLDLRISRLEDKLQEMAHGGGDQLDAKLGPMDDRIAKLEAAVSSMRGTAPAPLPPGAIPPAGVAPIAPGAPGESAAPLPPVPPSGDAASADAAPAPAAPEEVSRWRADLDQELDASNSSGAPGVKIYRQGLELMKGGTYASAIDKFAFLQKKYPKSPLAEPSEYFSGNAYYELGKYDQSILQFNDLVMRYPKGRFASAALLREAQAFVQLKDRIDARLTLQKLIADHSDAPEASAANAMMRDLEKD
jgi:tol-pal system protein YbgF